MTKFLGGIFAILAIGFGGLYLLALAALYEAPRRAEAETATIGSHHDGHWAERARDGSVVVNSGQGAVGNIRGHAGLAVESRFCSDGRHLVSIGADALVRRTELNGLDWRDFDPVGRLSDWFDRLIWQPAVRPAARFALYVLAQYVPLEVPDAYRAKEGRHFRDCPSCPELITLGPGKVLFGEPDTWSSWSGITVRYSVTYDVWEGAGAERRGLTHVLVSERGPRHLATLSRAFSIGRYQVATADWKQCVEAARCDSLPSSPDLKPTDNPPVAVTWEQAQRYATWLSERTRETYRLPSEAEWRLAHPKGRFAQPEWTTDCTHSDLGGAPDDGSPWVDGACTDHEAIIFLPELNSPVWLANVDSLNDKDKSDRKATFRVVREMAE